MNSAHGFSEGSEEWHASPKPKKPLAERLDSLSEKIHKAQHAVRNEKDEVIGFVDFQIYHRIRKEEENKLTEQLKQRDETIKQKDEEINNLMLGQDQQAFDLSKALDLIDVAYHHIKANPPDKTKMSYNHWQYILADMEGKRKFSGEYERRESLEKKDETIKQLKEVLKEILEIAVRYKDEFENTRGGAFADGSEILINKARKLISE